MTLLTDLFSAFFTGKDTPENTQDKSPVTIHGELQRAPKGPVLMLDIDGVLHRAQTGTFSKLPLLEEWLRKHRDVEIVIVSSWREAWSIDELRGFFSPDLQPRVLGTTPRVLGALREDEILACVESYQIEQWVAVDDLAYEFPTTGASHLVMTDYFEGLTEQTLLELDMLLMRK